MKFPLSEIPSADLLAELARRCSEYGIAQKPAWMTAALNSVCEVMGLEMEELMMRQEGSKAETLHRHVAIALLHHLFPDRPITHISALWGMHHGMVEYATSRINRLRTSDSDFEQKWQRMIRSTVGKPS